VKTIVLVLWTIEEYSSLTIKRNLTISSGDHVFIAFYFDELTLSHFVEQAFKVFFADMTKEKVIERTYVCVRPIADNIYCGIRMKEVFDGGEKFFLLLFVGRKTLDLHELLKL
jgi:hypothetical protein